MGKVKFAELDKITFNRIKRTKNANGMIDEKKIFGGLSVGDSVVFSCEGKKIEAYLRNIKIYFGSIKLLVIIIIISLY